MKKLLILILLSLWVFVETKAQSNYFITSVAGVQIYERGSGLLINQELTINSEVATAQRFWFLSPKGYDQGSGAWYQAGYLNVTVTNQSLTQWKKVSVYDFTGANLLHSQNVAPNAVFDWDFSNNKRLEANKDYYWKIENITSQAVVCNNDSKSISASNYEYIDVLDNDLNLPSGAECRLKAGQSLPGGLVVTKDQFTGLKVTTSATQGTFSFIYEAVSSSNVVLGEATATITVGSPSQYCTLAILSEQLQAGSQTVHEFTLYSPNAQINPFNYDVRTDSYSGTIVKSGTTPIATSSKEVIDFGTLATGTYYVTFSSSVSQCFDVRAVSHVASTEACNSSIISIDKLNGTNNYSVNSSFSNVSSIKAYLTNAEISVGTPLLSRTGITTPAFNLDLSTLPTGTYFLNIDGEGKYCKATKSFEHTLVAITNSGKLETWTKLIHNYKDNWIISGKMDYESGRDKFGLQSFPEKATNVVWKAFISDFENLGNSPKAKAIIGFRKDTTRNEVGVSVAITPNSIILQQRSAKSGTVNTLATVSGITAPVWVRLTKTGNDLVADFSKDLTATPVYSELGRINGAFTGFTNYQKYIGVASAKSDVIASARFQGFLGGSVLFDSPTVTITSPVIASNVASPSSGQSVTLSTSTSCIAPATNKWYKNTETVSFSAGSSVNVQAYNTDSYYARCENGLNKSAKSNVITFSISGLISCNNGSQLFEVTSAVYSSGSVTFSFNASNLSNTTWSVLSGTTVVKTAALQPSASTQTVNTTTLSAGNYFFKLDGISCTGTAQKAFVVSGTITAPTVTSVPTMPISGDNVTLTATGCVGNYNWYASTSSAIYATTSGSLTVSNITGGTYYYATCVGSSTASNYVTAGVTIAPPTITKNVTTPTAGQSVTFTSSGCQSGYVNKFYDSAEGNLLATALTYTTNAVSGNGYYAKCVGTNGSSIASNIITFVIASNSGVTITEPAKAQYFFSDGHAPSYYSNRANLPAIINNSSQFDAVNDVVYLENSYMKIGINLKRGGQICYASQAGSSSNFVYNGYDGGFQWQLDATQYLVGGILNGQTSGSPQNNIDYNTTQGGDYLNHSQSLIDYHAITNGYYIKVRPIMYNFNSIVSEIELEITYTLVGNSLKVDYKYVSFRTDGHVETNNPFRFKGFVIPVMFLTNNFTRYQTYTGSSPWTNGLVTDGEIPNCTDGQNQAIGLSSKEFWGLSYDPSNNLAIGVYNAAEGGTEASLQWEQLNKYSGNPAGTVFTGARTIMSMISSIAIPDGGNFTKNMTAYITIDNKSNVQNTFKTISGH